MWGCCSVEWLRGLQGVLRRYNTLSPSYNGCKELTLISWGIEHNVIVVDFGAFDEEHLRLLIYPGVWLFEHLFFLHSIVSSCLEQEGKKRLLKNKRWDREGEGDTKSEEKEQSSWSGTKTKCVREQEKGGCVWHRIPKRYRLGGRAIWRKRRC